MIELLKEYSSKKIELLKMEATEKSSVAAGSIIFLTILAVFFVFFFLLLNIGLGLLIGHYLDNYGLGVLLMSGFYLILLLIMMSIKKSIKNSVASKIINLIND
jgi:hypothetical protein